MTVYLRSWAAWSAGADPGESPDLPFLTSRTTRRMSQLSRMVMGIGHQLLRDNDVDDVIFASHYGELNRQLKITDGLLDDGEVSPTDFSYSVFNTPVALLSLAEHIHGATRAVYGGPDSFERGLLQSLLLVGTGKPERLLYIYGDEAIPALYQELVSGDESPYAIGMVLSRQADVPELPDAPGRSLVSIKLDLGRLPANHIAGICDGPQKLAEWLQGEGGESCVISSETLRMTFHADMV